MWVRGRGEGEGPTGLGSNFWGLCLELSHCSNGKVRSWGPQEWGQLLVVVETMYLILRNSWARWC